MHACMHSYVHTVHTHIPTYLYRYSIEKKKNEIFAARLHLYAHIDTDTITVHTNRHRYNHCTRT